MSLSLFGLICFFFFDIGLYKNDMTAEGFSILSMLGLANVATTPKHWVPHFGCT
jgi:hypothetical protein